MPEETLTKLPPPDQFAPVRVSNDLKNWMIGFGNSAEDGNDWYLTTDHVRASDPLGYSFPGDAKSDCKFVAALINAYREGRLVSSDRIQRAREEGFEEGFREGESKQAILEIKGREKFLETLRKETNA